MGKTNHVITMAQASKQKITLSVKPRELAKKIMSDLKDRAKYVLSERFGLESGKKRTLESIGQEYGITRERVRQIENAAIASIRKSSRFDDAEVLFKELKAVIDSLGGIVSEEEILSYFDYDELAQNHVLFFLTLGDDFVYEKENNSFKARWITYSDVADVVHNILDSVHSSVEQTDLVHEDELLRRIVAHDLVKQIEKHASSVDNIKRWLMLSNFLSKNPIGEWGHAQSPNIKLRGVRDHAFLVMRRHGSPMHFREVAESIMKVFGKKVNVATTHNELIKDDRFVLVGRGFYALSDWGYTTGVVRDVIKEVLEREGPLTKEEVIDKVLKERYLKKNTVVVNLQNVKYFKKDKDGKYSPVK